jgi:phage baseplate assembly protein W
MSSVGVDRRTGRLLTGWDHVLQSLQVIFITRLGDRIMRRTFGSAIPGLLGQSLTPQTLLKFYTAIAIAVELWEPRFRVRLIAYPKDTNAPLKMRQGKLGVRLLGDYRPRALEGDFTVEGPERTAKA